MDRSQIGTRLTHARSEAGLSRQKLADRSDVSKALIQKYEENKSRLSIYSFCKICKGLEVDPFQIIDPDIYDKFLSHEDKFLSPDVGDTSSSSDENADRIAELENEAFHKFLLEDFLTEEVQDFFKENLPADTMANLLNDVAHSFYSKGLEVYNASKGNMSPELSDLISNYCSLNREGRKLVEDLCEALTGNTALRN